MCSVHDSVSRLEFLIDRSLGRRVIAEAVVLAGAGVRTLADVYGEQEETIPDEQWLARAGTEGWLVLTKDARVRYRPAEIEAIRVNAAKVFVVSGRRLTGAQLAARVVQNLHRIEQAAKKRGPFVYIVYERQVKRVWPQEER